VQARVEAGAAGRRPQADFVQLEGNSVRRASPHRHQLKAKDAIVKALNPDAADPSYIVALNLVSRSPQWLTRSCTRCRCTWAWTCAAACTS
jgi:preprotein translocase subunit SecD